MRHRFSEKILLTLIALFILTATLSRIFDTGYAVKEPDVLPTQQVQANSTTDEAINSIPIVSQEELDIKKIEKNLSEPLKGQALNIVKYSRLYNVNARLVTAIIIHETGNGSAIACKRYKNVGGLMGNDGLMKFGSYEESIEFMIMNLKEIYLNKGLNSIDLIGAKYCPIGADNDKKYNLNQYWVPMVTKYYLDITNTEV